MKSGPGLRTRPFLFEILPLSRRSQPYACRSRAIKPRVEKTGFFDKCNRLLANALGKLIPILAILYILAGLVGAIAMIVTNPYLGGGQVAIIILVAIIAVPLTAVFLFGGLAVLIDIRNLLARQHEAESRGAL